MKLKKLFAVVFTLFVLVALVPSSFAAETFTINGVTISVSSGTSPKKCATYASSILKQLWTVKPGTVMTVFNNSYNLLREKSLEERKLTDSHVREYIQMAPLGSRIRICTTGKEGSNDWDLGTGHTMVLVAKNDAAGSFTVLEGGQGGSNPARANTYTYSSFVTSKSQHTNKQYPDYFYFYYIADYSAAERDYKNAESKVSSVTITFDPNGGSTSQTSKTVAAGSTVGTLPTATRSGYTFLGWGTNKNTSGLLLTTGDEMLAEKDTTLYAVWKEIPQTYTVTLADGSVCKQITVTNGSTYSNLPTPTKDGYTFDGWYTQENGGSKITTSTKVNLTSAQTLYAHWTQNAAHEHVKSNATVTSEHPHYVYYTCTVCGEVFTDGTTMSQPNSCTACALTELGKNLIEITPTPPSAPKVKIWSEWSEWSTTPVYATDTREVETKVESQQVKISDGYTEYRYGGYVTSDGKHECWCETYLRSKFGSANLRYSAWSTTRYSANGSKWTCGYCNGNHIHVNSYGADGRAYWLEYTLSDGKNYYWEESRTVAAQYETQSVTLYRYRDVVN